MKIYLKKSVSFKSLTLRMYVFIYLFSTEELSLDGSRAARGAVVAVALEVGSQVFCLLLSVRGRLRLFHF